MAEIDSYSFTPRAVVCMRGSFRHGDVSYDAEVAWNQQQVVIATGLPEHDIARAKALRVVDEMVKVMTDAAKAIMDRYPAAKE